MHSLLIEPPGRKPANKVVEMSNWFNKLDENNKIEVLRVVRESIETGIFGLLCVLDGVRSIENDQVKGTLTLYYEKNDAKQLLNDPDEEYLHDLFNMIVDE